MCLLLSISHKVKMLRAHTHSKSPQVKPISPGTKERRGGGGGEKKLFPIWATTRIMPHRHVYHDMYVYYYKVNL